MSFKDKCPACETKITWLQKWPFTSLYGTRQIAPCPHCGVALRWTRWPFIVSNLCNLGLLGFAFAMRIVDSFRVLMCMLLLLTLVISLAGGMLKFEIMESKASEPDEAASGQGNAD